MVHSPSHSKPTRVHSTSKEAFGEAERLAGMNPGQVFNVLESTHAFYTEKPKVTRTSLEVAPMLADSVE